MIIKKIVSIFIFSIFFIANNAFAIDLNIYTGDEYWEKLNSLNWIHGPGEVKHRNQGIIKISSTQRALTGEDARQMMYWINGLEYQSEIFIADYNNPEGYTDYRYFDSGYVKLDDWKDVNPDDFMKELRSGIETNNELRKKNGMNLVTSIDWFQIPSLNKDKNSVYYATSVKFDDNSIAINASTLLLGRHGYAEASYIVPTEHFMKNGKYELDNIINNYNFIPEKSYKRFTTGDKVAAAGIGGLLAASLGIKAFKGGLIATILIFAKKIWFIIFIPFVFAFNWIKNLFTKNK